MALTVMKFGGTSVGDISRIKNVARIIHEFLRDHPGDQAIVVVSAMAGETNRLLALARQCVSTPSPRELDFLASTGEQVAVALVSMALQELGVPARSLTGFQAGITTDTFFTEAKIEEIDSERLIQHLRQGELPVVAGFQGLNRDGDITTLGRGGSDITAVAIAAALKAEACYIYTDVDGVYSIDPRLSSSAKYRKFVSHEEMLELASAGAKVFHPRSIFFAMRYKVPLCTLSTFSPGRCTWIVEESKIMEKSLVTGITHRADEARLTITGLPDASGSFSALFSRLAEKNIPVDVITQTQVVDDRTAVSFTVPDEFSSQALEVCQALVPVLEAEGASIDRDIAKVSVVGAGMRYHAGIAARMFDALAHERIAVQMVSTSEIKISVVVPRKYAELAARALHQALVEVPAPPSSHPDGLQLSAA